MKPLIYRAGQIKGFTGIDQPYERPDNPEVVVDTVIVAVQLECLPDHSRGWAQCARVCSTHCFHNEYFPADNYKVTLKQNHNYNMCTFCDMLYTVYIQFTHT